MDPVVGFLIVGIIFTGGLAAVFIPIIRRAMREGDPRDSGR